MADRAQMEQLVHLTEMVKTESLARLRAASARRETMLEHLRKLDHSASAATVIEQIADLRILSRHLRYRDGRRAEINLHLAAQTAEWEDIRAQALRNLGRADVARKLLERSTRAAGSNH